MENDSSSTVHVTSTGDLRILVDLKERDKLLVDGHSANQATKIYVVSSAVMCLASPIWKTMFAPGGHFMEANSSSGCREVHLAEDDPDALLLLLRIAHLQFRHLPAALTYKQLWNLAIICDKYDTLEIVRPWLARWETRLKSSACEPGYEEWLFIAWTFGDAETYKAVAKKLAWESAIDGRGRCLRAGKALGDNMPPGAIGQCRAFILNWSWLMVNEQPENIIDARKLMIKAALKSCRDVIELYQADTTICKARDTQTNFSNPEVREKCDSLNLGCAIKAFKAANIDLGSWGAVGITQSVSDFSKELRSLPCFSLNKAQHESCKFTYKLDAKIKEVENNVFASGLDASILHHMAEQAKK